MAKRGLDIFVALCSLVLLFPVILLVAGLVRAGLGSPILFRQQRPGLHGKPFMVFKFRTMRDAVDTRGAPLSDSQRLTPLGRFLRAWSLDELPQLWNILRGDISLVGPRPLLMQYMQRYSKEQARRHEVRPGLTGWAQVNGRNALSWDEKFALDVWYVDHRSFLLDLKIIWMTAVAILTRRGIAAQNHVTMPEFMGNTPQHEPADRDRPL